MDLNDLLRNQGFDPERILVFRHRPWEAELNRSLRWLAAERPEVFNAYQQVQGTVVESVMASMEGSGHVVSFIGHEPGKALFVGLYSIRSSKSITHDEFWNIPANAKLKALGMNGPTRKRWRGLWFDLPPVKFYPNWKGRLVVKWPPPERSWWRRAHRNDIPIEAILEESQLEAEMPAWDVINLGWEQLAVIPSRWKAKLAEWRGIYYIFDKSDGKGYVGSAYGQSNLLEGAR